METVKLEGTKRTDLGSKFSKQIRKEGMVPCVLYGQDGLAHFSVHPQAVKSLVYTPDFKIAEISLDGEVKRAILKDLQFHPVTDNIMHLDFLQLIDGVTVKVNLPLRTKGASEGVKVGGKLIQQVRRVLVKTKPEHLVEELFVDITELGLGQSARVRDIEINENMQIMNPGATPVAMVEIPRALRSAQSKSVDDADAPAEAAE